MHLGTPLACLMFVKLSGQKLDGSNFGNTDKIKTMLCPIIINGSTIELTMATSCYCISDLLCCYISNVQRD